MNADLDIFALPVHPAGNVFPSLSEEELQTLADSIKADGLLHPLVVAKSMASGCWLMAAIGSPA